MSCLALKAKDYCIFTVIMLQAPTFFRNLTELTKSMKLNIDDAYRTLESYLGDTKYLAGNIMTIADISVLTTVSILDGLHPIDDKRYEYFLLLIL